MSKLTNSVKKGTLWSVLVVIVITLGIIFSAIIGFNPNSSLRDASMLTVTMNRYVYNTQLDVVEEECEKAIGDLEVFYEMKSEMSGDDCEIVYIFDGDVNLDGVEDTLKKAFAAKTANGAELEGAFISVSAAHEDARFVLAEDYILRCVIAIAVIAVLAFAYVSLRYSLGMGIVSGVSAVVGACLTGAIILLTRITVTSSVAYVVMLSELFALVATMLTLNKVRSNLTNEEPIEETVAKSVPVTEIAWLAGLVALAMFIVGGISVIFSGKITIVAWFSLACIVGAAVAAFVGIIYAPALYVPLKGSVDKNLAAAPKSDYVGAKKTSTKVKKVFEKKEVKAEPVKEEPACCGCDKCEKAEEPVEEVEAAEEVEEAPAEEAVETEEVAEEAEEAEVVEEVEEAPAEEVVETEAAESEENND